MTFDLRYPNITGKTDAEQMAQMKSYLHQLVEQLNWALKTVDTASGGAVVNLPAASVEKKEAASQTSFNAIKGLIIKSADIVNAYYEQISKRLEGVYVAESDFGTYKEETANEIKASANAIEQNYSSIQSILNSVDTLNSSISEVNAWIKTGLLDYDASGNAVYGLEIGQRNEEDGTETFHQYARFTASKLSFFDRNGNEVAYISDYKLFITHVEIIGSLTQGGFVDTVMEDKSVVTKWAGGV